MERGWGLQARLGSLWLHHTTETNVLNGYLALTGLLRNGHPAIVSLDR